MIITPICPHLLHHRSVIVASSERVVIRPWTRETEVTITIDGQTGLHCRTMMCAGDPGTLTTPLIQLEGTDFYTLLHQKLTKVITWQPERM